ncbi:ABC transporter substrate-binding protein/permease [Chlorobium sp.]|jgi:polar amino acid transport system substrate-binding protein|uniref:ABC transporter substrate-binding protein/permease n=1 Tax=Chlorobium sp. TaxID=1095 RepID=UPI003C54E009|nr:ABC transporter permease subunit [Chlorobiaceae bacterium]NTW93964.1 ABC transporter permease subunit [Chlorobiaceae bacterium]
MLLALQSLAAYGSPTLRWGADPSGGAPYVYADPANPQTYTGFDYEFAEALARQMRMNAEFVPTDWESIVASLNRREFDVIINGFEPTEDRAREMLFSKPYYLFRLQLTVRKDNNLISSLQDCKTSGKSVGTLVNCAASRLLENGGYIVKGYQDPVGAYQDLELGRVDAVLMDVAAEMFYARRNPSLKPAGKPFHTGAYVVGIRKSDSLLASRINTAIDSLADNGTTERIFRKWQLWDDEQLKLRTKGAETYDMTSRTFNWTEGLIKLLKAAAVTVFLAFGAMIIAVILGIPLALGQSKGGRITRTLCTVYIEFFRGTPVLVQLLFLYFGLPVVGITLPGWLTAIVGLGLNYAAYESQVYRTAFQAVPERQWQVAYSLGMRPFKAFRRIIFPQAFRIALPPMTNDFVALFKDTSTAFAIAVWELATAYRELANATQSYLGIGLIVCLYYLAMSLPLAHYAHRLERKLQRKSTGILTSGTEQ